jgi:Ribbon-helix-helix protein, copG family
MFMLMHYSSCCIIFRSTMPARKATANDPARLTVTLDSADKIALESLSKDGDRSLAWHVREAIRQYLAGIRAGANGKVS